MGKYADLARMLPQTVNLGGLMAVARELDISLSHEPPAEPFDECGREWERFSIYHLLDGLSGSGLTAEFADSNGRSLVADDHWRNFARTEAENLGDIDHVAHCVDWEKYALEVRVDYESFSVAAGEFVGEWWMRG